MKRAVTTVGFGVREDTGKPGEEGILGLAYRDKLVRWTDAFDRYTTADLLVHGCLPLRSPSHLEKPYAFKVYAILEAIQRGYQQVIWADASILPIRDLDPVWHLLETRGYWISENPPGTCGEWTSDAALPLLGINREQAFQIPQVVGTAFGLNLDFTIARDFFRNLRDIEQTEAFCGPWVNDQQQASQDSRVLGHRHDQTAMSVIAHRLGMDLTKPPAYIGGIEQKVDNTVFIIDRGNASLDEILAGPKPEESR